MNVVRPNNEESIQLFAPAKINWVLTVERKRPDGYHDIHTVFQAISLGDELCCRRAELDGCHIECNDPAVPTGPENLVARAWLRLRQAYPEQVGGMRVELTKHVPAGGGLGGGSSDGTAALVAVNRLFGLGLGAPALEAHAAALGSDCPFFIRGGTARGSGRGERLEPLRSQLPPLWLVLVHPGFHSSTAEAYGRIHPAHWENGHASARVAAAIARGDLEGLREGSRNVFSEVFLAADERYQRLAARMQEEGLNQPLLSGSGSAMFAFATSPAQARAASDVLMKEYPLAVAVQPRRSGVRVISPK